MSKLPKQKIHYDLTSLRNREIQKEFVEIRIRKHKAFSTYSNEPIHKLSWDLINRIKDRKSAKKG